MSNAKIVTPTSRRSQVICWSIVLLAIALTQLALISWAVTKGSSNTELWRLYWIGLLAGVFSSLFAIHSLMEAWFDNGSEKSRTVSKDLGLVSLALDLLLFGLAWKTFQDYNHSMNSTEKATTSFCIFLWVFVLPLLFVQYCIKCRKERPLQQIYSGPVSAATTPRQIFVDQATAQALLSGAAPAGLGTTAMPMAGTSVTQTVERTRETTAM